MLNYVNIDNEPGMIRDISSHAVISNDVNKMNEYKARKAIAELRTMELAKHQEEIDGLKNDIKEIKSMLSALLQR